MLDLDAPNRIRRQAREPRGHGVFAIHVRIDPSARRGHDLAPKPYGEFRADDLRLLSECGRVPPPDTTMVSWLPFYHDMGLMLGICVPVLAGFRACSRARCRSCSGRPGGCNCWQRNSQPFSAATEFRFRIGGAKDLRRGHGRARSRATCTSSVNGSERVHPATLKRFTERFARFNLPDTRDTAVLWDGGSNGVRDDPRPGQPPAIVRFDSEKLSAGHAERCASGGGTPLVSYGVPRSPMVLHRRSGDRASSVRSGTVGEIWVHGDNVATGYWQKPAGDRAHVRRQSLSIRRPGTPKGLGCEPEIWASSPTASCSSSAASRIF